MVLWFDLDDLIRYFCAETRPTGIQRLSIELYDAVQRQGWDRAETDVNFCRRLPGGGFRRVDYVALQAGLQKVAQAVPQTQCAPPAGFNAARAGWLRAQARRLRPGYRRPLAKWLRAARDMLAATVEMAHAVRRNGQDPQAGLAGCAAFDLAGPVEFLPGDWLVNAGSSWNAPYRQADLQELRQAGVRFAILAYDLIPHLFPAWSAPDTLREFKGWVQEILVEADLLLTISRNSAADLQQYFEQAGLACPPTAILPLGGLQTLPAQKPPPAAPFVLLVSTLEVRKNHALMFRVWQALLERYPRHCVPELVFAGKRGWLTADFLTQMENTGWLGGKIKFVASPADEELARLYAQCLFTVYPSFYEGWGLPVTESLSFGKTVAASNRSSIPEAGGDFCVYFDPENIAEATRVVEGLIMQPGRVAALERHIAAQFHAPGWDETAQCLLGAIAGQNEALTLPAVLMGCAA